jgi:hypothetical protein
MWFTLAGEGFGKGSGAVGCSLEATGDWGLDFGINASDADCDAIFDIECDAICDIKCDAICDIECDAICDAECDASDAECDASDDECDASDAGAVSADGAMGDKLNVMLGGREDVAPFEVAAAGAAA